MFNFLSVLPDFVHLSAIPPSLSWILESQGLHRWCLSSAADWSLVLPQWGYREFSTRQPLLPSASAYNLLFPIERSQGKLKPSELSLFELFLGYHFKSFRILSGRCPVLGRLGYWWRSWIQGVLLLRAWLNLQEFCLSSCRIYFYLNDCG